MHTLLYDCNVIDQHHYYHSHSFETILSGVENNSGQTKVQQWPVSRCTADAI